MKILITGANGYIGKSLCNALKDKYEVTAITRIDVDLLSADQILKFFKDKYFDVVIHCAVVGGSRLKEDNWQVLDANLLMYYNLLNCKGSYEKFIHLGSGAEYSQSEFPYGMSKRVISKSIQESNLDSFYNLRIYAVFDENELETRFIKSNLKRYIAKEPMQIYQNRYVDFFYMEDLIKLITYYIENNDLSKQVDCTYSENLTLKQIAEFINTLGDYKVDIKIDSGGMDQGYIGFNKNLKLEYIGLKQGIIKTYNKLK